MQPAVATVERGPVGTALVVLVHGTMDRTASFAKVQRELSEVRTVAYDRRGYARSRHFTPPAEHVDDHVRDLLAVVDGRSCTVAGHSYGAVVALAAAAREPRTVRSVVAFEPPTPWLEGWPEDSAGGWAMRTATSPEDAAEVFMRRLVGDEGWERLPERTKRERRNEGRAMLADLASVRRGRPFDASAVRVPVVLACGTRSAPRHIEACRRLLDVLPDAELHTIEGAGHGAHRSHPQAFAGLVRHALVRGGLTPGT